MGYLEKDAWKEKAERERPGTAHHEAGHCVAAFLFGDEIGHVDSIGEHRNPTDDDFGLTDLIEPDGVVDRDWNNSATARE